VYGYNEDARERDGCVKSSDNKKIIEEAKLEQAGFHTEEKTVHYLFSLGNSKCRRMEIDFIPT
jgi:hypothetical protein